MTFDEKIVRAALKKSWSARTAKQWSEARPFDGQCNVTAAVVADIFGAEILSTPWNEQTDHYYNRLVERVFDLTDEQFDAPIFYADTVSSHQIASRGFTTEEFETLKSELLANLGLDQ